MEENGFWTQFPVLASFALGSNNGLFFPRSREKSRDENHAFKMGFGGLGVAIGTWGPREGNALTKEVCTFSEYLC